MSRRVTACAVVCLLALLLVAVPVSASSSSTSNGTFSATAYADTGCLGTGATTSIVNQALHDCIPISAWNLYATFRCSGSATWVANVYSDSACTTFTASIGDANGDCTPVTLAGTRRTITVTYSTCAAEHATSAGLMLLVALALAAGYFQRAN